MIKKVVVIGPESTGKSTISAALALHYNTIWCPEYAREFLTAHGKDYSYDDLLTIAKGQVRLEDEYREKSERSPLFIDTNMYVMQIWCEYVFDNCHKFILDEIVTRKYDLYLLCNTGLPWVNDELREYPDPGIRQKLFLMYKEIMINQDTPWVEINGDPGQRLEIAVNAIDSILK